MDNIDMSRPHISTVVGTAAWLIEQLKALPPETVINVSTAYAWSPAPVKLINHDSRFEGVILDNGND